LAALSPWPALRRLPISLRLGATFAVLFLVVLAVLSTLAYWGLGRSLRSEIDRSLVTAVNTLGDRPELRDIDDRRLGGVESPEFDTQVLTADRRVLSASDDDMSREPLLTSEQVATVLRERALFTDVLDDDGEGHRTLAIPLDAEGPQILLAVAELESVRDAQAQLLRLAVLLSPLAGLLAGAAGWFVAREGLRPIARMTADAKRMSARDPFPRLAVPPSRDEVAQLGTTLNELLDRIEEGRRREREFTADASHELRTPLAVLRAELELARIAATDDRFIRALDSALEESDRLGQLIEDLLLLARTDERQATAQALVDVADVVDPLLPRFRTLAQKRGITLHKKGDGDAVVRADARALGRSVANLLDNAIRHAAQDGTVTLEITQRPDGTAITVTDDGPGVPPEERDRITQRFTQLDRTAVPTGGAGLGLAIVASVTAVHGGRVTIADAESGQGLAVTIQLPNPDGPGVTGVRDRREPAR
jgi:signal transduction histidine kinase